MTKVLQCPHQISISGLIRGCMLGKQPDSCEACDNPDKRYIEITSEASTTFIE